MVEGFFGEGQLTILKPPLHLST